VAIALFATDHIAGAAALFFCATIVFATSVAAAPLKVVASAELIAAKAEQAKQAQVHCGVVASAAQVQATTTIAAKTAAPLPEARPAVATTASDDDSAFSSPETLDVASSCESSSDDEGSDSASSPRVRARASSPTFRRKQLAVMPAAAQPNKWARAPVGALNNNNNGGRRPRPVPRPVAPALESFDGVIAVHKDSYGFIRIGEGIPDWFFHVSELKGHAFPVGTAITFDAGIDRKTRRQICVNVRVRTGEATRIHPLAQQQQTKVAMTFEARSQHDQRVNAAPVQQQQRPAGSAPVVCARWNRDAPRSAPRFQQQQQQRFVHSNTVAAQIKATSSDGTRRSLADLM
jgi:hypothetical protein